MQISTDNAKTYIIELLNDRGLNPSIKHFAILARDLSKIVGKSPVWSGKYLHSVYREHRGVSASPLLLEAIHKALLLIDGIPAGVNGTHPAELLGETA